MNTVSQSQDQSDVSILQRPHLDSVISTHPPSVSNSPTRAPSTGDLLSEREIFKDIDWQVGGGTSASRSVLDEGVMNSGSANALIGSDLLKGPDDMREDQKESKDKNS
jgi:hypothetical protein